MTTAQSPEDRLHHLNRLDVDAAGVETEVPEETAATTLTTLLHREAVSRRNETWGALAWSGTFIGSMLWLFRDAGTAQSSLALSLLLCFALMGSIGWALCLRWGRRAYGRKRSLTAALSRIDDKTQVGALIRTLQVQDTPVCSRAKQSLIELLPALRASDASLLGSAERKILLRQLAIFPNDPGHRDLTELFSRSAYRREMDLRLAILKALEQVGGEQELAVVERLTRGLPTLHSALRVPAEIQTAARTCLPYLQSRANDQRAGAQLLRASSLPVNAAELLRPAAAGPSTPPEQLLRAGQPQS